MHRLLDWAVVATAIGAGAALMRITDGGGNRNAEVGQGHDSGRVTVPQAGIDVKPVRAPAGIVGGRVRNPGEACRRELFNAICEVESGGDPGAIGDGGKAVGIAQIWCVMVDDCNRIVGNKSFTYQDRRDVEKSFQMFNVFADHYGRDRSVEWLVRAWNGGPRWEKRPKAVENSAVYWRKVKKILVDADISLG